MLVCCASCIFVFKQKTAYEMRISDWSSDVCSSDLRTGDVVGGLQATQGSGVDPGLAHTVGRGAGEQRQIGRASCRERVCKYVSISVVAESLKKKQLQFHTNKIVS